MTMKEAEVLALSTLKQVMEEKVTLACQCCPCVAACVLWQQCTLSMPRTLSAIPRLVVGSLFAGDGNKRGHCFRCAHIPPVHPG